MIYAKKIENETADYVDASGKRYAVLFVLDVYDPSGRTPEELGFTAFESKEAALTAWGLTYDPPSPLQGYGVASPLPESESETDNYGVASPLPEPPEEAG